MRFDIYLFLAHRKYRKLMCDDISSLSKQKSFHRSACVLRRSFSLLFLSFFSDENWISKWQLSVDYEKKEEEWKKSIQFTGLMNMQSAWWW